MIWLFVLCFILIIIITILCIKISLMKKAIREIRTDFSEKLSTDTNTLISVSSHDKSIMLLAADINTQLKELHKQRHRFLQGDMELKNAITGISHDLRTPLTAISAYLDLLDHAEMSESVKRYTDIIKNRTDALKQLTEELFRYSVISSPDYHAETEPVTVNSVLEESIADYYAALQQHNIIPTIHIPETPVRRNLNRAALSRIFSNLISNAIKYSDGDLDIILDETGKITFSNAASDLSEVQVERFFDRFYTVENARRSTGLGLSIAKILLEQMNGSFDAGYEKGRLNISIQLPDA